VAKLLLIISPNFLKEDWFDKWGYLRYKYR